MTRRLFDLTPTEQLKVQGVLAEVQGKPKVQAAIARQLLTTLAPSSLYMQQLISELKTIAQSHRRTLTWKPLREKRAERAQRADREYRERRGPLPSPRSSPRLSPPQPSPQWTSQPSPPLPPQPSPQSPPQPSPQWPSQTSLQLPPQSPSQSPTQSPPQQMSSQLLPQVTPMEMDTLLPPTDTELSIALGSERFTRERLAEIFWTRPKDLPPLGPLNIPQFMIDPCLVGQLSLSEVMRQQLFGDDDDGDGDGYIDDMVRNTTHLINGAERVRNEGYWNALWSYLGIWVKEARAKGELPSAKGIPALRDAALQRRKTGFTIKTWWAAATTGCRIYSFLEYVRMHNDIRFNQHALKFLAYIPIVDAGHCPSWEWEEYVMAWCAKGIVALGVQGPAQIGRYRTVALGDLARLLS